MSHQPLPEYYNQQSARLTYRALTSEDIEPWSAFFTDNPTERFLGGGLLGKTSLAKASMWIERQIWRESENVYGQLAVLDRSTGEFVGLGGIIARDNADFEITYSFFPKFWGKGYGTELAVHFKEYAFEHIDVPSVISMIHKENEASMHVARKNGMEITSETNFLEMPIYVFRVFK
ncbi:MAG: GNAT family N-acetyltransferase [Crocinitomicaceae bacterium]|nr:GNAT family N-acetyltransferase [Crocinitomicaceae bacterium]